MSNMKYIYTLLSTAVFLVALLLLTGFAIKNVATVEIHYYLDITTQAPLSLVVLISLFTGIIMGALLCLKSYVNQRKRLIALEHALQSLNDSLPQ
jgi:uncharacterized integral membrane protein